MTDSPEQTIYKTLLDCQLHLGRLGNGLAHLDGDPEVWRITEPALEAIASLRQRQEECKQEKRQRDAVIENLREQLRAQEPAVALLERWWHAHREEQSPLRLRTTAFFDDAVQAAPEVASLRTQLQQAEQERDAAVHELEVIENFGVLPLYNELLAEHSEAVTQLQQAETALERLEAAIREHKCVVVFTASDGMPASAVNNGADLRAALAAPPANPLGRPPECGGGAFAADSTESTNPAPPPDPQGGGVKNE